MNGVQFHTSPLVTVRKGPWLWMFTKISKLIACCMHNCICWLLKWTCTIINGDDATHLCTSIFKSINMGTHVSNDASISHTSDPIALLSTPDELMSRTVLSILGFRRPVHGLYSTLCPCITGWQNWATNGQLVRASKFVRVSNAPVSSDGND